MNPTEIRLDGSRRQLFVTWENGVTSTYTASQLRELARDAGSIRLALNDWAVPAEIDLEITGIDAIGNYAVRLAFSDGHDRGIFPWPYLAEIADLRCSSNSSSSTGPSSN